MLQDGRRNPRTETVQRQKIKAFYLRFTPLPTHTHTHTFHPHAISSFLKVGVRERWSEGSVFLTLIKGGREESFANDWHSPSFLNPSLLLPFLVSRLSPLPFESSLRALVIIGEVLVTANEITI